MDPTTTTTLADHAILIRQAGDGFYLTGRGEFILCAFFTVLMLVTFALVFIASRR